MRFLHTSDWHLGRQFHNCSLLEDQAFVLEQIVAVAVREAVDLVIVAGDIYDRAVPPAGAVELLDKVLDQLCRIHGIQVILIPGNHDSAQRLGFGARQLAGAGLHIFDTSKFLLSPLVLEDESGPLAFYGIPYLEPSVAREQFGIPLHGHEQTLAHVAACIRAHIEENASWRSVVISHCFLDGGASSESERPLSIGGAERVSVNHFRDFDYAALGHLHGEQHRGVDTVRYSGSILKYSFSEERQHKSVTLVNMDAQGACQIKKEALVPIRDVRTVEGSLAQVIAQGRADPCSQDYLQVRLSDTHAILDIMGKIREVYPNVLHLERPGLLAQDGEQQANRERLRQGELSMFADFYEQIRGEAMDARQTSLLKQTIAQLQDSET